MDIKDFEKFEEVWAGVQKDLWPWAAYYEYKPQKDVVEFTVYTLYPDPYNVNGFRIRVDLEVAVSDLLTVDLKELIFEEYKETVAWWVEERGIKIWQYPGRGHWDNTNGEYLARRNDQPFQLVEKSQNERA